MWLCLQLHNRSLAEEERVPVKAAADAEKVETLSVPSFDHRVVYSDPTIDAVGSQYFFVMMFPAVWSLSPVSV